MLFSSWDKPSDACFNSRCNTNSLYNYIVIMFCHYALYYTAIAALKGQFVGHCYHSIVFQKVLRPFLATFWVSRGSVVTIKIILV